MLDTIPEVTRYMKRGDAVFILTRCEKRFQRPPRQQAATQFRHGINMVDYADTFATMSTMQLCNHLDPEIAAWARSILDHFIRSQPAGRLRAV